MKLDAKTATYTIEQETTDYRIRIEIEEDVEGDGNVPEMMEALQMCAEGLQASMTRGKLNG